MENTILKYKIAPKLSVNIGKLPIVLSGVFLFIIGLTIFQDFLASKRNGYAFYLNESLLFKTIWLLFIPILVVLYKKLKNETYFSFGKTTVFIVSPILVHFFILPFVSIGFSMLFYEGRYDLLKFFSFTLGHDLYKLVIVYTSFVIGYKYFSKSNRDISNVDDKPTLDTILINNGKENVVVNVNDITHITSDSPYITIHLKDKKHLHSETLKSICDELGKSIFVRVHKSTVVNITKVNLFKSRLNGDYDLQLKTGDLVRLSRTYAPDFKRRFSTSHRVNL
jgi:hypothetical protein